jgi:hypothetical protein
MKQNVSVYDFCNAFMQSDTYKNNFSYDGLTALYEYLEEYEESTGEEMEFDMIALCCEYSEYTSAVEAVEQYNGAVEENEDFDDEDKEKAALAWLEDQTQMIPFEKGIIIADF